MSDDDIPPVGDKFTGPSSAPIPGDDQVDADLDFEGAVIGEDVSCRNCIHFSVCAYYAGIQPMLEAREDAAIDADDIAAICDEYLPADDLDVEVPTA